MINETDRKILEILQGNARTSNAEIARKVGLAPSAVFERIRKLEERDVIRGYRAEINPKVLGLAQLAFTFVRSNDRPGGVETGEKLAEIPEILEVHHVAGEDCFLVKARARDAEALGTALARAPGRDRHDQLDADDDRARDREGDGGAAARPRRRRAR